MDSLQNKSVSSVLSSIEHNVFSPWGLDRSNNDVSNSLISQEKLSEFKNTFENSREQYGIGELFNFDNHLHSTYYKDEWDGLLTEQKREFLGHLPESGNIHLMPIASNVSEDMELEDALFFAREEVGVGGLFISDGQIYTTYTQEEVDNLNSGEKDHFLQIADSGHINVLDENLSQFDVIDLVYQDPNYEDDFFDVTDVISPIETTNSDSWESEESIISYDSDDEHINSHTNDHSDDWDDSDHQADSNIYPDNLYHQPDNDNLYDDHHSHSDL